MLQQKILLSACLLGEKVRYDGADNRIQHPLFSRWLEEGRFISICPEVAGGLPTPRPPAELQYDGRVITVEQLDVTPQFVVGAERALQLVRHNHLRFALLKAKSPSCGNHQIYDGKFSRTLIPGAGLTASLLQQHGVEVFNEHQLEALAARLAM